ncbi:MAG: hypothetical protein LBM99_00840, partial [Bacillales bacterium]|nr:hypothetical protein [Bacillales bacterium]
MKKFVSLLLLAGLGITACTPKTSSSSVDSSNVESSVTTSSSSVNVVQDVTSVQITMNQEVLTPGNYPLTAICLPENSIQTVNWGIVGGSVAGIAINNAVLSVGITAEDGLQFQISATSTYDPTKKAFKPFTVSNEVSNVIEIGNETELLAIFNEENYLNQSYALTNHITLTHQWPMIGVAEIEEENLNIIPGQPFNGLFDGRGFTISGIDIRGNALFNAGFFAQIGTQGVVKNTTFEGSVLANGWSGGIAGINQGTISNCVSKVSVSVSGTSAGSIVSVNRGIIDHSIGLAHLSTSLGNDKARSAGLLVANESTLDEVYGDMETLGTPNYTSMIPSTNPLYMLPTSAMKLASTFADFNTDVWYLADGSYPLLKHQGFVPPISEAIVVISTSNIDVYDLEVITDLQIEASIVNGSGTLNYSL